MNCPPFQSTWVIPVLVSSCCPSLVFCAVFCRQLFVFLSFYASSCIVCHLIYPFGIFKFSSYAHIHTVYLFKDWSQFVSVHEEINSKMLRKGVYHIFEFISNEPNNKLWSILINEFLNHFFLVLKIFCRIIIA
jgi:hypothetical protein